VAALRQTLDIKKILGAKLAILHDPIHGVSAQIPSKILDSITLAMRGSLRRSSTNS